MDLSTKDIRLSINGTNILKGIDSYIESGEFVGLVGPNGSGKSTLLKSIYRVLKPDSGAIYINEKSLLKMPLKESAKNMAVVSQFNDFNFDFKVQEIVMMGRAPHKNKFELDNMNDHEIVYEALRKVDMIDYVNRNFSTLSGGEKQRIMIARALAQQAEVLILDEPTNHLDIKYQIQLLNLIKSLNKTVFAAIHDLNLAAAYCDKIYVVKSGEVFVSGTPNEVLTQNNIYKVFGIDVEVINRGLGGKPYIMYNL